MTANVSFYTACDVLLKRPAPECAHVLGHDFVHWQQNFHLCILARKLGGSSARIRGPLCGRCVREASRTLFAGHTASWGKGYPELLTDCYDAQERPTGVEGPVNPARNETYALLWKLLREAAALFPDSYIHLGGDEVPFDCWQVLRPALLCHTV